MKFVHIADLHIGLEQTIELDEKTERKTLIWEALNQVFSYIQTNEVDFLFIPGDLFQRQPTVTQLKDFNALCERVPKTQIVCMAGNHDYIRPNSNYLKFSFAQNVYFFQKNSFERIYFKEQNTYIYGFSYWEKEITKPLYDTLKAERVGDEAMHVLLAHGGDSKHIPIQKEALKNSGFDYIAMGHIHIGGQIVKNKIVMAGALVPSDKNDMGPHGFWHGEITKEGQSVFFQSIKLLEYRAKEIQVTPKMTERMVLWTVRELLSQKASYELYKIFLKGRKNPHFDIHEVYNEINSMQGICSVEVDLVSDYDIQKLLEQYKDQLLGKYIQECMKYPENMYTKYALYEGVDAIFRSMEHK